MLEACCVAGAGEVECILSGEHVHVRVGRGVVAVRIEEKEVSRRSGDGAETAKMG